MNGKPYCFDTNIFFYSLDTSSGAKYLRALHFLSTADPTRTIVLLQCLGELTHSIQRRQPSLTEEARKLVHSMLSGLKIVPQLAEDLEEALLAQQQHGLQFWDAMLWATARRAGCSHIFSEDFQDGRVLGGVTFRNPFKLSDAEWLQLLSS